MWTALVLGLALTGCGTVKDDGEGIGDATESTSTGVGDESLTDQVGEVVTYGGPTLDGSWGGSDEVTTSVSDTSDDGTTGFDAESEGSSGSSEASGSSGTSSSGSDSSGSDSSGSDSSGSDSGSSTGE